VYERTIDEKAIRFQEALHPNYGRSTPAGGMTVFPRSVRRCRRPRETPKGEFFRAGHCTTEILGRIHSYFYGSLVALSRKLLAIHETATADSVPVDPTRDRSPPRFV
jgi:hypothetical protein